jgi:DNA-binding CsgD family transcriptional regulator/gamma-glutamylcyclotransferase (GGCT)/AIG2-like uncharacterized protein YtfP
MRRLFVCGSLRKGELNHDRFAGFGDCLVVTGTISSVLLKNLGNFPALFPSSNSRDRVVGEVYEIPDELGVVIDAWESNDGYLPRAVRVRAADAELDAEAYFYRDPDRIADAPTVEGGDWSLHADHPRPGHKLEDGRRAFDKGAWSEVYDLLTAADTQTPLGGDDLHRLATAAYLIGEDAVSIQIWSRAHATSLEKGDPIRAARSAFWLGFTMLDRPHQRAQAAGWIARAQRLVDDAGEPCVEQGWLLCAKARLRAATGDFGSAFEAFKQATEIAVRFGDRDLVALSRHGQGRALLILNRVTDGLALLDEVMVGVTSGEIGPIVTGAVYCSVITACHDRFDLQRAQEWTTALQSWCSAHPDLIPFRGYCSIRRSELMQLHGAWDDALSEAIQACERLMMEPVPPEAGAAYYQLAELYRVRGDFAKADDTYRLASQAGGKTQPGLALLRLSQGQTEAADAAIRVALKEPRDARSRVLLLAAAVEIMLAANDLAAAREASDELAQLAARLDLPFPNAISSQAHGVVALAEGQPLAALEWLRGARAVWQELDAPYEVALTRVLIGRAYRELGDQEGAQLEFDAAHETLEKLGAVPATGRVVELSADPQPAGATGLTGREIEVLRLIATGVTNRIIAERLQISEKTVARHISNIFTKLDLPSRAAATAFAYEHKLV